MHPCCFLVLLLSCLLRAWDKDSNTQFIVLGELCAVNYQHLYIYVFVFVVKNEGSHPRKGEGPPGPPERGVLCLRPQMYSLRSSSG